MNTKFLIDNVDTCINDVVEGLLYTNSDLIRLEGLNVVLRRDINEVKQKQVTLLSGTKYPVSKRFRNTLAYWLV